MKNADVFRKESKDLESSRKIAPISFIEKRIDPVRLNGSNGNKTKRLFRLLNKSTKMEKIHFDNLHTHVKGMIILDMKHTNISKVISERLVMGDIVQPSVTTFGRSIHGIKEFYPLRGLCSEESKTVRRG